MSRMNEIVQKEDKILRQIAKEVPIADIRSRKVETIIRRMQKALDREEDGVAIAAPQIGESLRIFVVSKRIFEIMYEMKEKDISSKTTKKSKRENLDEFEEKDIVKEQKDMIFINPEVLKSSKRKTLVEEGCLSVRWLYGKVERNEKTLVRAYDEKGKLFTFGGSGLLSQVFQHEIDHLNGALFIDKAKDLKEMKPEK